MRAFSVLQECWKEGEEQVVSQAVWRQLVRLVQPGLGSAHRELLWSVLDHQNQGCIGNALTHDVLHLCEGAADLRLLPSRGRRVKQAVMCVAAL